MLEIFKNSLINSKTIDEFKLSINQENDSEKKLLINIIQIIEKKEPEQIKNRR